MENRELGNTTASQAAKNVQDLNIWGDGDLFKLLSKASSKSQGWMKSTKAMEIEGVGCVVQVTTQQLNDTCLWPLQGPEDIVDGEYPTLSNKDTIKNSVIAEALTFVPGVKILTEYESMAEEQVEKVVSSRRLVPINYTGNTESV